MSFIYIFGIFTIGAYIVQMFLGYLQIKHFNKNYNELRQKGKVAIGRKTGKVKAGTIVLFAVKEEGEIIEARIMQGVTILAKFRDMNEYVGHDIHYIDRYHPLVQKENKLTQSAMENAREVFLTVTTGNHVEEAYRSPFQKMGDYFNQIIDLLKIKMKDVFSNGNNY